MADRKISQLVELTGPVSTADGIAIADASASQTKQISPKTLVQQGILLIDPGSIPASKLDSTEVVDDSVTTAKLADRAVTAAKLDDNSSGIVSPGALPNGIRVGQVGISTVDNKFYVWTGSQWALAKAAGSVNTIEGDTTGVSQISVSVTGDTITLDTALADTTGASEVLAGPTGSGGAASFRQLLGADLPTATSVSQGVVVVSGDGLGLDGNRIIIDNTAVPLPTNVFGVVEHDSNGLITNSRKIIGGDLPPATIAEIGAVRPGDGIAVAPDGTVSIDNSVTLGTAAKVAFNDKGLITAGLVLEATDLPDIPASKITGQIDGDLLVDRTVGELKLADYSTCYVQEGNPGGGAKLGQLWFTPSSNQLRVYGRGSAGDLWLSVGFGALQAQNLRWAGTIDANTSTIVSLTSIGVSEGLIAGGPIPVPSDALSGVYFVTQVEGSNINEPAVQADTFTEGDWLLCIDQAQGYTHIDTNAAGGGGGGGAQYLNDLLDVEIGGLTTLFGLPRATLLNGQFLMYDSISGMWVNSSVLDGGSY